MPERTVPEELEAVLGRLRRDGLVLFPIRHHSPACSLHLRGLIASRRPEAVLVEAPRDFEPLIPALLDERTRPPVAVYTTYVDRAHHLPWPRSSRAPRGGPPRLAAWYPFCEHSPELVALRAGAGVGAELRFIDLTYPENLVAARATFDADRAPRVASLLEEGHLERSEALKHLAKKTGCRDHDELWDHLFELQVRSMSTEELIDAVATYCWYARADHSRAALAADGTLARERAMAAAVRSAVERFPGDAERGGVVVVTGGFHTVALPALLEQAPEPPRPLALGPDDTLAVLTAYGFEQLDQLNGYAAGLPSPAYYHRLWSELAGDGEGEPFLAVASALLVELGRLARERDLPAGLSTADMIAALEQARRLASLRGHAGPAREDLLDAVRSCFVKGALDAEGAWVMGLVREALSGREVGRPAPGGRQPPLVLDFRERARRCHLKVDDTERRRLALELYRKPLHRQASRLLHAASFLEVPFATLVGGPDFVAGHGVDMLIEHWDQAWSPATDAALVERSVLGATVPEAAARRLHERIGQLEEEGRSRSVPEAVRLLVEACRMGLHAHGPELIALIALQLREDPAFASVTGGLAQLVLLWRAREPLEAWNVPGLEDLVRAGWERACYLLDELERCPSEELQPSVEGLCGMRELLAGEERGLLDPELYWPRVEALCEAPRSPAMIVGGCAGLLHSAGRLSAERLGGIIRARLGVAAADVERGAAFLQGILRAARECAWQSEALLATLDALLHEWPEEDFRRALPQLRLAWADLTPQETERVARLIAARHGEADLGELVQTDIGEEELALGLRLSGEARAALEADGLGAWLDEIRGAG